MYFSPKRNCIQNQECFFFFFGIKNVAVGREKARQGFRAYRQLIGANANACDVFSFRRYKDKMLSFWSLLTDSFMRELIFESMFSFLSLQKL